MNSDIRHFRYDGDRTIYTSAAAAWGFLLLIESSLVALLIAVLVPIVWLKFLLLAILLALNGWAIRLLRSPLQTFHTLTPDTLQLRYGTSFAVDLPRPSIIAAQPVKKSVGGLAAIGTRHDLERDCVVAVFSEKGQILLTLSEPISVQLGPFQQATTRHLLINVDDRDEFLAALDLRQTSPALPSLSPQTLQESIRTANSVEDLLQAEQPTPYRFGSGDVALYTTDLTRHFGNDVVVEGLDLSVRRGEIYGFLGPNGAGKTTTIKMLVGLLRPTAGRVIIDGHDVWVDPLAAKAAFGYVPDRSLLYERLTGVEYLQFLAQVRSMPKAIADPEIERLLDLLGLTPYAYKLSGTYSYGMKRKLALAGALLHRPPVLILDEPLNGLDPRSARRLKDLFIALASEGKTIFFSTHDLHTAETVCHRVGIIHEGQLLVEGSAVELRTLAAVPDLESVFLTLTAETPQEVQE
jgi:ABC-2 type transport system ATP-binding protein